MSSPSQDTRDSSPFTAQSEASTATVDHTDISSITTPATSLTGTPCPKPIPTTSPLASFTFGRPSRRSTISITYTSCSKCDVPIPLNTPECNPLPCSHTVCRECAYLAVLLALHSAALGAPFQPARCCEALVLPLTAVGRASGLDEFIAYQMRLHEAAVPPPDRLYCYAADCAMYITKKTSRVGTCPRCFRRTCRLCGRKSHMFPCPPGVEFRRPVGKVEGWLRRVEVEKETETETVLAPTTGEIY